MSNIFEGYLLVTDMDGTLLNSDKKISQENLDAIKYFQDNGGKFTIATGRMVAAVKIYCENMSLDLPAIVHNGGKVYDYSTEESIVENSIEEERKQLIKKIKKDCPNIGIEVFADEVVYVYQSCELTKRYEKYDYNVVYDLPEEVWDKPWVKILLLGSEEDLDLLEKDYKSKYDNGTAFRSGESFFDIVSNGISKGLALGELIEKYDIDKSKVIAIGDNMNDIEMLDLAEYGFYIKGGAKRALERAKLMAPTNNEHAIEYVVKWIEAKLL